jgi:hypothetical protein
MWSSLIILSACNFPHKKRRMCNMTPELSVSVSVCVCGGGGGQRTVSERENKDHAQTTSFPSQLMSHLTDLIFFLYCKKKKKGSPLCNSKRRGICIFASCD